VLARNTLWNYIGFGVNLAVNFALFPFVVRHLGEAPAGLWLLLGSVTGYMGLFELGIVPALMQRIAAALGRGVRSTIDEAVSTAFAIMMAMMLIALQMIWFTPAIAGWLQLPPGYAGQAVGAISVAIAGVSLRMPQAPFQAVLLGCQRQDRCNQLWITLALTKALATVVLITLHIGVVGIVTMEAVVHLLAGVLQIMWVRKEMPLLRVSIRAVRIREAHDLLAFGVQVTLAGIFVLIVEQTDKLVIAASLPIEQVTRYSAAWKLYMLAYSIPTTLLQALSPVLANLHGAGETERFRTAFLRMTKYSAAVALPLAATLGLCSGWILRLWMGPSFADVYPIVAVLVCGFAVTSLNHAGHSALLAKGQVRLRLWLYDAPQAVLNLALSLWLVRRFGLLGVALGTLAPALLMQPVFLRLLSKSIGVGWSVWRPLVTSTVIPVLVAFVPALIVRVNSGPYSAAPFIASAVSSATYLAWFCLRGMSADERTQLLARVRFSCGARLPQSQAEAAPRSSR